MALALVAFFAGCLTVLAPCILPLLPVIIGGSLARTAGQNRHDRYLRPLVIIGSLALSIVVFTLLLKFSTSLLGISPVVWQVISSVIVIAFGLSLLVPSIWESLMIKSGLESRSNRFFAGSQKSRGLTGDALLGLSLGPIFNSCSPTYALIIASVLPISFFEGFVYILLYALGLSVMLLLLTYGGQAVVSKLRWASNPNSIFKRVIGGLLIITGLIVLTGADKKIQSFVLDQGIYNPVSELEQDLR